MIRAFSGIFTLEQDNSGRRAASRAAHVLRTIGTALLAAIFAAIFLTMVTFFALTILTGLMPGCGAPGDSGGCAM